MLTFDAPMRDYCVPKRTSTNTPLQALNTTANASNAIPNVKRRWIWGFGMLAVTAKM